MLIQESFGLAIVESPGADVFNADGTVDMVLIRPCHGRGLGSRIYEAEMLAENAQVFAGVPMFDNHDSPAAKKARAGLPRSPSELGGFVRESRWDPDYTTPDDATFGYQPGAVIGTCVLSDVMEALVRKMPEAIKTSVAAQATNLQDVTRNGRRGWLVEGIVNDPENTSVDLVTKAGAGGRVRALLESLHNGDENPDLAVLETVDDDTILAWLTEHRPNLIPAGGNTEMNLQEALQSEDVKTYLNGMIAEAVDAEREAITESVREELGQTSRLRGLASEAHRLIEAAKGIGKTGKDDLLAAYSLTENDDDTVTPGRSLALVEAEVDDDGKVTKPARQVLAEAIEADCTRVRNIMRESAPTLPVAHGAGADSHTSAGTAFGGEGSAWADRLRSKGIDPALYGAQPAASE